VFNSIVLKDGYLIVSDHYDSNSVKIKVNNWTDEDDILKK